MKLRNFQTGQSLVELLVVIGLLAVFMPAILTSFVTSREGKAQQYQRLKAQALLNESVEALRNVREGSWSAVSTDGTFYPQVSAPVWQLTSGIETVDEFSRSITLSEVRRDSDGNVVSAGGTVDPSTRKAELSVSWTAPYASSLTATYFLTRYLQNTALTQTTQADFSSGNTDDTEVISTNGGTVRLRQLGINYRPSGTFESATIDTGAEVAFNNITRTASVPEGSQLEFQIAVNSDNSTWDFFGPDSTGLTYFTGTSSAVPLSNISGRYFRYKAYFEGDGSVTPLLEDVSVNYSP